MTCSRCASRPRHLFWACVLFLAFSRASAQPHPDAGWAEVWAEVWAARSGMRPATKIDEAPVEVERRIMRRQSPAQTRAQDHVERPHPARTIMRRERVKAGVAKAKQIAVHIPSSGDQIWQRENGVTQTARVTTAEVHNVETEEEIPEPGRIFPSKRSDESDWNPTASSNKAAEANNTAQKGNGDYPQRTDTCIDDTVWTDAEGDGCKVYGHYIAGGKFSKEEVCNHGTGDAKLYCRRTCENCQAAICPTTESSISLGCTGGATCDRSAKGWNCCDIGSRAQCPLGFKACNDKAGNGIDFSCWPDCGTHGGEKICQKVDIGIKGTLLLAVPDTQAVLDNTAAKRSIRQSIAKIAGVMEIDVDIHFAMAASLMSELLLSSAGRSEENLAEMVNCSFDVRSLKASSFKQKLEHANLLSLENELSVAFTKDGLQAGVHVRSLDSFPIIGASPFQPPPSWDKLRDAPNASSVNFSETAEIAGLVNFTTDNPELFFGNGDAQLAIGMALAHAGHIEAEDVMIQMHRVPEILPEEFLEASKVSLRNLAPLRQKTHEMTPVLVTWMAEIPMAYLQAVMAGIKQVSVLRLAERIESNLDQMHLAPAHLIISTVTCENNENPTHR